MTMKCTTIQIAIEMVNGMQEGRGRACTVQMQNHVSRNVRKSKECKSGGPRRSGSVLGRGEGRQTQNR